MKIDFLHTSHLFKFTLTATYVMGLIVFQSCKKVGEKPAPSEQPLTTADNLSTSKGKDKKDVDIKLIAENIVSPSHFAATTQITKGFECVPFIMASTPPCHFERSAFAFT